MAFPLWFFAKWLALGAVSAGFIWWARRAKTPLPTIVLSALMLASSIAYDVRLFHVSQELATALNQQRQDPLLANPAREAFAPAADPAPVQEGTVSEADLDRLKQKQENTWVYFLLLQRCGKVGDADYVRLAHAMESEAQASRAPTNFSLSTQSAARGTVESLYDTMACNQLPAQGVEMFLAYLQGLAQSSESVN